MFDLFLTASDAVKSLEDRSAYYLVIDNNKSELVKIDRNLNVSKSDVTTAVQKYSNKKYFDFEGKRYRTYRKIQ